MKSLRNILLVIIVLLTCQGCAGKKQNLPLAEEFWQQPCQHKIVIASFTDPVPQLYPVGNSGLLDLAIINGANKSLNTALKNYDLSTYHKLSDRFVTELRKRKISVTIEPNKITNEKMEKALIAKLDGNKLLIINLVSAGVLRDYYSFIPKSYPTAFCRLRGKLIDSENKELWYHEAEVIEQIEGKWDQPPKYSNILNAVNQALINSTQELLDSFFSGCGC